MFCTVQCMFNIQHSKVTQPDTVAAILGCGTQNPSTMVELESMSLFHLFLNWNTSHMSYYPWWTDISYAWSIMNKYQYNPRISYKMTERNIINYLQKTKQIFMIYRVFEIKLYINCYTYASFQMDWDAPRS